MRVSEHINSSFGCLGEVLGDSGPVNVHELCLVLVVQINLPVKEHGTKFENLRHIRHFKSLSQDFVPSLETFANLSYLFLALAVIEVVVLQIQLKLELEALEDHASS